MQDTNLKLTAKERHKKWRDNNKDKMKEYRSRAYKKIPKDIIAERNRQRKHKVPEKWLLWTARARAKKKGLLFSIKEADIVIPECCPVLGIELRPTDGSVSDSSPTLDRLDSSLGYIPGNVRVISHKANRLKSDMTLDEVKKLLRYMEESVVFRLEDQGH